MGANGGSTDSGTPQSRPLKLTGEPLNREPPVKQLLSRLNHFMNWFRATTDFQHSFLTEDGAYDRNHGPIPQIDRSTHTIKVDGAVGKTLSLNIDDLATSFPQHEVVCALQCAGNRRHTMRTRLKEVDGIDWGDGAIMNCSWRGPRLRDVLMAASPKLDSGHVAFACHQQETQNDSWYGGSIELERALRGEANVLLALERNSKPLSPKHGAPIRVIVPGVAGARSVKWLDRITVQEQESTNHYHKHDYKILPEEAKNAKEAEKYWDKVPPLQDMPINSVIISPQPDETVIVDTDGTIEVSGYAVPGGADGPVVKVEVSTDVEGPWTEAGLQGEQSKWSWVIWKARIEVEKGTGKKLFSRAIDKGGNQQTASPVWNLRGVRYNGYGESNNITMG
ncbi:sulfite oxidase [Seiridium cupressi]